MKIYSLDLAALVFARRRLRLSSCAVARALGISYATVANWEAGKTQIPSPRLAQLMSLYNLTPSEVFTVGGVADAH